jgi:hypothetical protein
MKKIKIFKSPARFYFFSGLILVTCLSGMLLWNHFKYKFVNRKLDKLVTAKSGGLYQLNYSNLRIDEALGNIDAENITLTADSPVYQSLADKGLAPSMLISLRVAQLHIAGVKTPKALLHKEIKAHILKLTNAEIEILVAKKSEKEQGEPKKLFGKEFYEQILGNLTSIQADSIILENARVQIRYQQAGTALYSATGLNISLARTSIDSLSLTDSTRILFSDQVSLRCQLFESVTKNDIFHFQVRDIAFESSNSQLDMGGIYIKPRLSETAFAKSNRFAKDRFDVETGKVQIRNISISELNSQRLVADQIEIYNASLHVFRDISFPHDSVDRTHDFPQEVIMRLPIPLYIPAIDVKNAFIEYKEKNSRSDSSGSLRFYQVNAVFRQVTNIRKYIDLNNQLQFRFKAKFLNEPYLTVNMNMRLNDKKGRFHLEAKLEPMHAQSLNPLLKPMALAEIEKGEITGLQYTLDANNTQGKGRLLFTYEDLKVKLLKKDDDQNRYKTRLLPTIAAGIVVKKSNPQGGETRLGKVEYTRDIHRSIFNFMWKSLLAGIKQTAL